VLTLAYQPLFTERITVKNGSQLEMQGFLWKQADPAFSLAVAKPAGFDLSPAWQAFQARKAELTAETPDEDGAAWCKTEQEGQTALFATDEQIEAEATLRQALLRVDETGRLTSQAVAQWLAAAKKAFAREDWQEAFNLAEAANRRAALPHLPKTGKSDIPNKIRAARATFAENPKQGAEMLINLAAEIH
jgi:hypothetical protein